MSIPASVVEPAQALLDVAARFWSAASATSRGPHSPVLWLQGTSGSLVIYTPGPHAAELLAFAQSLGKPTPEAAPPSGLDRWLDTPRCCE